MNHQPYEIWLYADEPLNPAEHQVLEEHLAVCERCRQLSIAWHGVRQLLETDPEAAPEPGFVARWQTRLEVYRQQSAARLTWGVLILTLGASSFLAILLALQWATRFHSPIEIITSPVYDFTVSLVLLDTLRDVFLTFVRVTPPIWWSSLILALSLLLLVWIFTITRLNYSTWRVR